jgi:hypothetical protein
LPFSWPCDSSRSPTLHWPGHSLKPASRLGPWRHESVCGCFRGIGRAREKARPEWCRNRIFLVFRYF